ncbi:hypothetical protein HD599_003162 [Conyzicola lurida]|uniref:Uncharacterized protein n=1 Tax=Conyzicola lurida TaxID=1172621 RepID=A0A841ATV8_9MICO|nr:hypothetical protein [Conyzicola lurida]MBB5844839.1 hypothetical protein [Conyzicola lurida]
MNGGAWFISIFLLVGLVAALAASFTRFYARWRAYRYSLRIRVDLPVRLERVVTKRLMSLERGGSIGGLAFTAAATAAFASGFGVSDESSLTGLYLAGAAFAGAGVGTAVAALTGSSSVAPDQPRVARSGAVEVRDYLAPLERIGARIVVAAAVVALLASTVLAAPGNDGALFAIAFFAIAGALSLVLFEVAGRRVVDASQPAGSTAELVWDDAVRATTLRALVTAPLALGAYCLIFGVVGIAETADSALVSVTSLAFAGIFSGVAVAAAIVSLAIKPESYFVRRLWPNLRWSDTADAAADAV